MSTGTNEINTINRATLAGGAMVARIVIGNSVHFLKVTNKATLNFISAIFNSDKIAGKEKFNKLLLSGEKLQIFELTKEQLKDFNVQAKRYGVVYSVIKSDEFDKQNGIYEVAIKSSDAGKFLRIKDRIGLGTVEAIAGEENTLNEPDGVTMTTKDIRDIIDLMLQPDNNMNNNMDNLNPYKAAEAEPLSAAISPEKRASVIERINNIKAVKENNNEQDSSFGNIINQMLSNSNQEDKENEGGEYLL